MLVPTLCDLADSLVFRDKLAAYTKEQERQDRQNEGELSGAANEELAARYIKESGKRRHMSDCATSMAPAYRPGPCNCDAPGDSQ